MQPKSKAEGEKKIDKYIFSLKNVIGQGAYATVYLGREMSSGESVAIKVIDRKIFANAYNLKNIHLQIQIMKKVEHENIVRLLDVYQTSNNMYIVTQFCQDGDLALALKRKKRFSEKEALKYLKDIMAGFKYLVEREITHRDLKPANILIKDGVCKISDFGFAKNLEDGESTVMRSIVGTPLYMSPQILSRMKYTNKSDLWSIGLIYYEMIHGFTPWPAKNQIQLVNNIMSKPIQFQPSISEKSREFVRGCLKIKQEERMSWQDAFNHPLLKPTIPQQPARPLLMIHEQDKQNVNSNIIRDISAKSLKFKRDISQNKPHSQLPTMEKKGPKTPTRSRLTQILALTPNDKQAQHKQQSSQSISLLKKNQTLTKTQSSLSLRPKFK